MMMTITSNACPFKLIVEFPMETKSGYPTTTAKDEFLVKFMYWQAVSYTHLTLPTILLV